MFVIGSSHWPGLFFLSPRLFSRLNHLRKVRQRCSHSIFSSQAIFVKFLDQKVASVFPLLWATAAPCVYSSTWATNSNLVWFSWALFNFAEIFTWWSWIVKEYILRLGCVIAFIAKVIYRFKVNFLKRFFWNACLQREFVIPDFYLPRREKYPEKVIWMTFQTNIKLCLFRKEFSVKKGFLMSAMLLIFFPRKRWRRKS